MRQPALLCIFSVNAVNEIELLFLLSPAALRTMSRQVISLRFPPKTSHLFFMMYNLLQEVDGSAGFLFASIEKSSSLLDCFNHKQQASTCIMLPTGEREPRLPWQRRRVCFHQMQSSHFMGLVFNHLQESGGVCCRPNQTLPLFHGKQGTRSQLVTGEAEWREAVGSEISYDSLLQHSHRGVEDDSLRSRPVAHQRTSNFFCAQSYFQLHTPLHLPGSPLYHCSSSAQCSATYIINTMLCSYQHKQDKPVAPSFFQLKTVLKLSKNAGAFKAQSGLLCCCHLGSSLTLLFLTPVKVATSCA